MDYIEKNDLPVELLYNIWIATDSNAEKTIEHANKSKVGCFINLSGRFSDKGIKATEKLKINIPPQMTDLDEPQLMKTFNVLCDIIDQKFRKLEKVYLVGTDYTLPIFVIIVYIKKTLNLSFESALKYINQKMPVQYITENFDSVLRRIYGRI